MPLPLVARIQLSHAKNLAKPRQFGNRSSAPVIRRTVRGRRPKRAEKHAKCNDLQSSAARPDFIGQIRPTFDETVDGHKPEISETQTGLFETDLQSSPLTHIP
jgi:hypothetical protein